MPFFQLKKICGRRGATVLLVLAAFVVLGASAAVFGMRNVYTAGASVRPSGVVEGDFTASAGNIHLTPAARVARGASLLRAR